MSAIIVLQKGDVLAGLAVTSILMSGFAASKAATTSVSAASFAPDQRCHRLSVTASAEAEAGGRARGEREGQDGQDDLFIAQFLLFVTGTRHAAAAPVSRGSGALRRAGTSSAYHATV